MAAALILECWLLNQNGGRPYLRVLAFKIVMVAALILECCFLKIFMAAALILEEYVFYLAWRPPLY